jgi:hypothetical protein
VTNQINNGNGSPPLRVSAGVGRAPLIQNDGRR